MMINLANMEFHDAETFFVHLINDTLRKSEDWKLYSETTIKNNKVLIYDHIVKTELGEIKIERIELGHSLSVINQSAWARIDVIR